MVTSFASPTTRTGPHWEPRPSKTWPCGPSPMPDDMINEAGNFPSEVFLEYPSARVVGEMPEYADLRFELVE